MFGGPNHICARANKELKALEEQMEGSMFVFLSDVLLNQSQVIASQMLSASDVHLAISSYSESCCPNLAVRVILMTLSLVYQLTSVC